jgi:hypothetical protein
MMTRAAVSLPRHHTRTASLHRDDIPTMTVDDVHGVPVSAAAGEIRSDGGPCRMRPSSRPGRAMIHGFPASYSSQHPRMRSNRKVLSALRRWQCAITYATP